MEFFNASWPWYVTGPLISLVLFAMVFLGKSFGVSSNLENICAMVGAGRYTDYFKIDWKKQSWNLLFLLGTLLGGTLASFTSTSIPDINPNTVAELQGMGIEAPEGFLPISIFSWQALSSPSGWIVLVLGGLLIGFGTRYAGGCTSGHAITGLSSLQLPSLVAVIGFFIGGLVMINLLFPFIF